MPGRWGQFRCAVASVVVHRAVGRQAAGLRRPVRLLDQLPHLQPDRLLPGNRPLQVHKASPQQ